MNAISILEQQRADEVLRLEIAYSNLYRAYLSGNREEMIAKYVAAGNVNIPHFTDSIYLNTKQTMLSNGIIPDVTLNSVLAINIAYSFTVVVWIDCSVYNDNIPLIQRCIYHRNAANTEEEGRSLMLYEQLDKI